MPVNLDDALTSAISLLRDAGESGRMPSGEILSKSTSEFLLDSAFTLLMHREKALKEHTKDLDQV